MNAPPAQSISLSYKALFLSLSRARISAYSLDSDDDSTDAVARYMWNMALSAAFQPVLHIAEVAFRNALYSVGLQTTAGRPFTTRTVPCWLDANPTLLERNEDRDVLEVERDHLGARLEKEVRVLDRAS